MAWSVTSPCLRIIWYHFYLSIFSYNTSQTTNEIRAWVTNYNMWFYDDAIIYPCPEFNVNIPIPGLQLGAHRNINATFLHIQLIMQYNFFLSGIIYSWRMWITIFQGFCPLHSSENVNVPSARMLTQSFKCQSGINTVLNLLSLYRQMAQHLMELGHQWVQWPR